MTEDTQPGANRKVPPTTTRPRKGRVANDPAEVERLKKALFAALDRTGFNLTEIAEKCGFANANRIYNLRNGHSETLSVLTYVALARHLKLPISELLGIPDRIPTTLTSARGSALIEVAVESVALSFGLVRAAMSQYYEEHVEQNDPARDQAAKIKLLPGFFLIDRGLDALAQDITELLDHLREIVPEIPPPPSL